MVWCGFVWKWTVVSVVWCFVLVDWWVGGWIWGEEGRWRTDVMDSLVWVGTVSEETRAPQ